MKFSALNVDFSSPSPDPLDSKRPAQVGVKEGHPSKKWLSAVVLSSVKMVADRLLITTSTGDELLRNVNIDDLEP